jgi:predicted hotdog family 3-hydroxylacyl-ACP dehydratase
MQAIETYVPHRSTMLLLDRLLHVDNTHAVAQVVVPFDGLFVRHGHVGAWVGMEYMAQTVAAWSGANAAPGATPRVGYLLSCRLFKAHCPQFACGSVLQVHTHLELMGDNGMGLFNGTIFHQGTLLVSARLSVFESPENSTHAPI